MMKDNAKRRAPAAETAPDRKKRERRTPKLISVILPAYNESAGIAHAISEIETVLERLDCPYELIVVDDGSRDGTFAAVEELGREKGGLRGLRLSRNFGKESALLAGLSHAAGDVVVTMDADLQHPPALIPQMLERWSEGIQVVHGTKRSRGTDSLVTRSLSRLFNWAFSATAKPGIDLQDASDFKLLDRSAVRVLVGEMPERQRFYRGLAAWVGFDQEAIPYDTETRKSGQGKWSTFALVELATTAIISYSSIPLRIVTLLGVATLFFALVISTEALWSWFMGKSVSGFVTIIITLLLLGSFIMISLGIIGEYIAKIYDEIKSRPVYVIDSHCGFGDDHDGE